SEQNVNLAVRHREQPHPARATLRLPAPSLDSSLPGSRSLSCARCSRLCWHEWCTRYADRRYSTEINSYPRSVLPFEKCCEEVRCCDSANRIRLPWQPKYTCC